VLWILRFGEIPHDNEPLSTFRDNRGNDLWGNSTGDKKWQRIGAVEGPINKAASIRNESDTGCFASWFRWRLYDRASRKIADPFLKSRDKFVAVVSREPNDLFIAKDLSRKRDRRVILTDMNSICVNFESQIWPVIHDERNTMIRTDALEKFCALDEFSRLEIFLAELDNINAPGDALTDKVFEIFAVGSAEIERATGNIK